MGLCKFNSLWLQDEQFSVWLKLEEGNSYEAHCTLRGTNIYTWNNGYQSIAIPLHI